jgi:hypothetical protein
MFVFLSTGWNQHCQRLVLISSRFCLHRWNLKGSSAMQCLHASYGYWNRQKKNAKHARGDTAVNAARWKACSPCLIWGRTAFALTFGMSVDHRGDSRAWMIGESTTFEATCGRLKLTLFLSFYNCIGLVQHLYKKNLVFPSSTRIRCFVLSSLCTSITGPSEDPVVGSLLQASNQSKL